MLHTLPSTHICEPFCVANAQRRDRQRDRRHTSRIQAVKQTQTDKPGRFGGLGDLLGPIGLTLGNKLFPQASCALTSSPTLTPSRICSCPDSALHFSQAAEKGSVQQQQESEHYRTAEQTNTGAPSSSQQQSINSMTTAEWESKYAADGCVDLWVEEEFNSGSRLMVSIQPHASSTWAACLSSITSIAAVISTSFYSRPLQAIGIIACCAIHVDSLTCIVLLTLEHSLLEYHCTNSNV